MLWTFCFIGLTYPAIAGGAEALPSTGAGHSQRSRENHTRRSHVSVEDATADASVDSLAKFLLADRPAVGTSLRCAARVHRDCVLTSVFCFVNDHPQELAPRSVKHAYGPIRAAKAQAVVS